MTITFDNIFEKVVNNRTISRKDKHNAISKFLKENSGEKKPASPEEITVLESLKAVRKSYLIKNNAEKIKPSL